MKRSRDETLFPTITTTITALIIITGQVRNVESDVRKQTQTSFVSKVGEVATKNIFCECFNSTEEFFVAENGGVECQCSGKELSNVPGDLDEKNLCKLTITHSDIKFIGRDSFQPYRATLMDVTLWRLPYLRVIEEGIFRNMTNLRTVYISEAPQIKFVDGLLSGVTSRKFKSLRISQTGLIQVPDLSHLHPGNILHLLDLDLNKIQKLPANSIKISADQVTLNRNEITIVEDYAFNGSEIAKLNLRGNENLIKLENNAFKGLKSLRELDLSETSIESLPVVGLSLLETLRIERTPTMKVVPSIYDLGNLKEAKLTHPFHCCAFKYPQQHNPERYARQQHLIRQTCLDATFGKDVGQFMASANKKKLRKRKRYIDSFAAEQSHAWGESVDSGSSSYPAIINYKNKPAQSEVQALRGTAHFQKGFSPNSTEEETYDSPFSELENDEDFCCFHENSTNITNHNVINAFCGNLTVRVASVTCSPEPNALNPCEDIMGSSWLRISVWFVVILAVVGNLCVIIVVLLSGGELTVTRFLMSNLGFADFCMGLYLLLIASMDLHSVGSYFNFAFDWQYGIGCQMAGFLTVFASHLSIFTLTVVTIERWFAITYAIYLTKRITISAAAKTMLAGWVYSILVAALPLFGISNYSSTSICLPMQVNKPADKAYLYSIIILNGVAFALIVFCYAQIYLSLGYETRHASTRGEMTIAKKMALLIFTDFATFAPIAFFGLTALAGYPLIGVTRSKILLVFFYPLNACANPYLYAIMTAQYRRDFFIMLARCGICKKRARFYTSTTTFPTNVSHQPIPLLAKSTTNGRVDQNNAQIEDVFV